MDLPHASCPYDRNYSTCEHTHVSFLIYAENNAPETITSLVGLEPTDALKKDILSQNAEGTLHPRQYNVWEISSEGKVESLDLRHHLDWLLVQLLPVKENIAAIQQMPTTKMNLRCVWWSKYAQGGPTLWPAQMRAIADLNLECGFSISFFEEEIGTKHASGVIGSGDPSGLKDKK